MVKNKIRIGPNTHVGHAMTYGLSITIFIYDLGHAHFDCDNLANGKR